MALSEQDKQEMREVINAYTKDYVEGWVGQRAWDWARDQLQSMPTSYDSRCELGKAFEDAVYKIIMDHRGAQSRLSNETYDAHEEDRNMAAEAAASPRPQESAAEAAAATRIFPADEQLRRQLQEDVQKYLGDDVHVEINTVESLVRLMGPNVVASFVDVLLGKIRELERDLAQAESETMRGVDATVGGG